MARSIQVMTFVPNRSSRTTRPEGGGKNGTTTSPERATESIGVVEPVDTKEPDWDVPSAAAMAMFVDMKSVQTTLTWRGQLADAPSGLPESTPPVPAAGAETLQAATAATEITIAKLPHHVASNPK